MPTDRTELTGEAGGPVRVEFELALKKVYGAAAASVVDVEAAPVGTSGQSLIGDGQKEPA